MKLTPSLSALLTGLLFHLGGVQAHRGCSTKEPAKKELEVTQAKIDVLKRQRSSMRCKQCITIDVHVVVFTCSNGMHDFVTAAKVVEQMDVINQGYSETPFKFRLLDTKFEVNDSYCSIFTVEDASGVATTDYAPEIGTKYRKGDYATINMYIGGYDNKFSFATFPNEKGVAGNPKDGVFLVSRSLPGGDPDEEGGEENLGTTATHEVSPLSVWNESYGLTKNFVVNLPHCSYSLLVTSDWTLAWIATHFF